MKPFTVKCNKCGSEDILFLADEDRIVTLVCAEPDCDNEADENELSKEE